MSASIPQSLLEAVDAIGFIRWSGLTFRHTAPGRNGLSGAGSRAYGGRWNPPDLVPTIYLAQPRAACIAEFKRMAAGQGRGPASFLPRTVHHVQVNGLSVIDLTGDRICKVGLDDEDIMSDNRSDCQLVGQAAHFLGAAGLVAPSATKLGITVAVFETKMHGELEIVETEEIDFSEVDETSS